MYWKLAMKRYVDSVGMVVTASFTAPACINTTETTLSGAALSFDDTELASCSNRARSWSSGAGANRHT